MHMQIRHTRDNPDRLSEIEWSGHRDKLQCSILEMKDLLSCSALAVYPVVIGTVQTRTPDLLSLQVGESS